MLLTLLSAFAAAQPEAPSPPTIYPELGEESVLSGEPGCADVVECPPSAGFVPFARLQGGQFWMEDEDSAQFVSDPSARGNLFSVFTDFGRSPAGSAVTHEDEYDRATVYDLTLLETIRTENVEFSLQHLYDDGWVNERPALRFGANAWGLNLDAGELPLSNIKSAPQDPNLNWLRRWLKNFEHAYYVSYGLRTLRVVDEFEYDFTTGNRFEGTCSNTKVDQTNIGPELTIGRTSRSGRWLLDLSGTVLVGYGHARFKQFGHFGENIRPTGSPFQSRASEDFLATYAELDFTTSNFLTSHWTIDLTARAFVLGEHFSAEDHVVWNLPDFGISESKQSHSYAGGNLFVGASYVW